MHSIITRIVTVCLLLIPITGISAPAATPADKSLLAAAEKSDLKAAQQALASGAKVSAQDVDGWTPLLFAASKGNVELVMELLKAGADPNQAATKGQTPLMGAVLSGDMVIVSSLLKAKGDPLIKLPNGASSIDLAKKKGDKTIIAMLEAAAGTSSPSATSDTRAATTSSVAQAALLATPGFDEAKFRTYLLGKGFELVLIESLLKLDIVRTAPKPKIRKITHASTDIVPRFDKFGERLTEIVINSPVIGITEYSKKTRIPDVYYLWGRKDPDAIDQTDEIHLGGGLLILSSSSTITTYMSTSGNRPAKEEKSTSSYNLTGIVSFAGTLFPLKIGNKAILKTNIGPDWGRQTLFETTSAAPASTLAEALKGNAYEIVCMTNRTNSIDRNAFASEKKKFCLDEYGYCLSDEILRETYADISAGYNYKRTKLIIESD